MMGEDERLLTILQTLQPYLRKNSLRKIRLLSKRHYRILDRRFIKFKFHFSIENILKYFPQHAVLANTLDIKKTLVIADDKSHIDQLNLEEEDKTEASMHQLENQEDQEEDKVAARNIKRRKTNISLESYVFENITNGEKKLKWTISDFRDAISKLSIAFIKDVIRVIKHIECLHIQAGFVSDEFLDALPSSITHISFIDHQEVINLDEISSSITSLDLSTSRSKFESNKFLQQLSKFSYTWSIDEDDVDDNDDNDDNDDDDEEPDNPVLYIDCSNLKLKSLKLNFCSVQKDCLVGWESLLHLQKLQFTDVEISTWFLQHLPPKLVSLKISSNSTCENQWKDYDWASHLPPSLNHLEVPYGDKFHNLDADPNVDLPKTENPPNLLYFLSKNYFTAKSLYFLKLHCSSLGNFDGLQLLSGLHTFIINQEFIVYTGIDCSNWKNPLSTPPNLSFMMLDHTLGFPGFDTSPKYLVFVTLLNIPSKKALDKCLKNLPESVNHLRISCKVLMKDLSNIPTTVKTLSLAKSFFQFSSENRTLLETIPKTIKLKSYDDIFDVESSDDIDISTFK